MKSCPACNFSFPDFHQVCDFDGTELVAIPEKPSASAPRPTLLRRLGKSPFFLIVVTSLALVSSAILFGYYDSISQSAPVAPSRPADSSRTLTPASGVDGIKTFHVANRSVKKHMTVFRTPRVQRDRAILSAKSLRTRPSNVAKRATPKLDLSRRHNPHQASSDIASTNKTEDSDRPARDKDKDPKVVAMLKSTWRVLKRPFKF